MDWTPALVRELISNTVLPSAIGESIGRYSVKHPECLSVTEDEFIAAAALVKPELVPVLNTADGRAWLRGVPAQVGVLSLKSLFWPTQSVKGVADG